MNSCASTLFEAWAPPFRMFIIGTGRMCAIGPPRYRYSGSPLSEAAARATARDTASMAFAPSLLLLGVPSASSISLSIAIWSSAGMPSSRGPITSLTLRTASRTPFPRYRFASPSRSSAASCSPVEAPLGTAARPVAPLASVISASTVGLPRLSRISRACTSMMVDIESRIAGRWSPRTRGQAIPGPRPGQRAFISSIAARHRALRASRSS